MRIMIAPLMLLSIMAVSPMILSEVFAQNIENDFDILTPEDSQDSILMSEANVYFTGTNGLRVRATPEDAGKVTGLLSLNEKVRVVTGELINGKYVEVQIIKTVNPMLPAEKYYGVCEFLTEK